MTTLHFYPQAQQQQQQYHPSFPPVNHVSKKHIVLKRGKNKNNEVFSPTTTFTRKTSAPQQQQQLARLQTPQLRSRSPPMYMESAASSPMSQFTMQELVVRLYTMKEQVKDVALCLSVSYFLVYKAIYLHIYIYIQIHMYVYIVYTYSRV